MKYPVEMEKKASIFYDVMDEVLGTRPAISPPLIVDTSRNSLSCIGFLLLFYRQNYHTNDVL